MKCKILFAEHQTEIRMSKLKEYELVDLNLYPDGYNFEPGVRYLVVGPTAYKLITSEPNNIHLGMRAREFFHECAMCKYLVTRKGYIFKFTYLDYTNELIWITENEYKMMESNFEAIKKRFREPELRKGISRKSGKPWYRLDYKGVKINPDNISFLTEESYLKSVPKCNYKIIRERQDIINALTYYTNLEEGTYIGLDYETHGKNGNALPFETPYFDWMGVGLATVNGICAYFDIEYYERSGLMDLFKEYYERFLDKHHRTCITYNVGFEIRATYLMLHKMYMFQDAATLNKLEGLNSRNYSLKFSAQKYIPGIGSWDDSFDECQDLFWSLFKDYTLDNYETSPQWKKILQDYPEEISEFKLLIKRYWGDPFGCIPANILGHYCSLDAFHTVLIRKAADDLGYSKKAWTTFDANMRMGAWLNISGVFIDKPLQESMSERGYWMIAYGKLNILKLYFKLSMKDNELPEIGIPRLEKLFFRGLNPYDGKSLMTHYYSPDSSDGFNYELMESELGQELMAEVVMTYTKYFSMLDIPNQKRSRKQFMAISNLMNDHWKYTTDGNSCTFIDNGAEHRIDLPLSEIIRRGKISYQIKRLNNFSEQMRINEPKPSLVDIDGTEYPITRVIAFCDGVVNTNAPDYKPTMAKLMADNYWSVLMDRFVYPENLTKSIDTGEYQHFEWDCEVDPAIFEKSWYIREVCNLRLGLPVIKECLTTDTTYVQRSEDKDEDGKIIHRYTGPEADKQELLSCLERVGNTYSPLRFYFEHTSIIRKIDFKGKEFRAYSFENPVTPIDVMQKALAAMQPGLGIDAAFFKSVGPNAYYWNDETKDRLLNNFDDIDVTEVSLRGLTKFNLCYRMARKYFKSLGTYVNGMLIEGVRYTNDYDDNAFCTERWNHENKDDKSIAHIYPAFHVAEKKSGRWSSGFHTLPGHGMGAPSVKRIVTAPKGYLMSYFDISGAEVRCIAYLSGDEFMLHNYALDKDPYIEAARVLKPNKDEKFYKDHRPTYKNALLGSIYGMGPGALAGRIGCTSEEAAEVSSELFGLIPGVDKYIKDHAAYPGEHQGKVNTVLGQKINILSEPKDRWTRLGINLVIQGHAAITLAEGFEHNIQASILEKECIVRPLNVVHDSSQNYFRASDLFKIQDFYNRNMQEYLYNIHGINYKFDTLVGPNYYDMVEMETIEYDKRIKLKGNYISIEGILDKLNESNVKYRIVSIKKKDEDCMNPDGTINPDMFKPKIPSSCLEGFIKVLESYWLEDYSNFTMEIERI